MQALTRGYCKDYALTHCPYIDLLLTLAPWDLAPVPKGLPKGLNDFGRHNRNEKKSTY